MYKCSLSIGRRSSSGLPVHRVSWGRGARGSVSSLQSFRRGKSLKVWMYAYTCIRVHLTYTSLVAELIFYTLYAFSRFGFEDEFVELFAERVASRGLCAQAQAESLK